MARLWSNRTPALMVSRSPIVTASLAKAAAVMNSPPLLEGGLEMAWNGRPLSSVNLTPVGMTAGCSCSPFSICVPTFHW